MQLPTVLEDGKLWLLRPSRYRAHYLSDSFIGASTKLLKPKESSTSTVQATFPSRVKVEPSLETIYELSNDKLQENIEPKLSRPHTDTVIPQPSASKCPSISRVSLQSQRQVHSIVKSLK